MKVRDHRIDDPELITGTNKNIRLAVKFFDRTPGRGCFERPHDRGADRDHTTAAGMRLLDRCDHVTVHIHAFRMQPAGFELLFT